MRIVVLNGNKIVKFKMRFTKPIYPTLTKTFRAGSHRCLERLPAISHAIF